MSEGGSRTSRGTRDASRNGSGANGGDPSRGADAVNGTVAAPALDLLSAARGAGALVGRLACDAGEPAPARVPRADLDERAPAYIPENLPGLWMLASLYFRAE